MVPGMSRRALAVLAVIPLLLLAGCGSPGPSQADVQSDVRQYVKDSVGKPGVTVDEPRCEKSGDTWNCDVLLHASGGKTREIQVQATCKGSRCDYALTSLG
jgi:hypothetical protein